jgi:hypothetical protein
MIDRRIVLLERSRPNWFEITHTGSDCLGGFARVEETVWREAGIGLIICAEDGLAAAEEVAGTRLPARCVERHIQGDHTFCQGIRPIGVGDLTEAESWWETLRQYLWLQSVAEQTGVWPDKHYLDHGTAGNFHESAMDLADRLGLRTEYDAAHDGEVSWITDRQLRLADKNGNPINGRAACPRGCRYARQSVPKLRRNCSRRHDLARLVYLEQRRREELDKFWKAEIQSGVNCCGTMRDCPLRTNQATSSLDPTCAAAAGRPAAAVT